ncbi:MAG: hemoglobin/transferrin/lactoferrin receptor protein [Candidatus Latescibacterota bacterium]|jgi:hemoglobin/transferrin/lactoferrin receptor protein
MRLSLLLGFCLISYLSLAQKIQVLEQESLTPIIGVAVFNSEKNKSGVTDFDGYVDISKFLEKELINFQHISHDNAVFPKNKIIENGGLVSMAMDANSLKEVVLSVAKFKQSKKDIPQKILTLTSDDVLFGNPQTAADLLQSSGQVYVQKSQLGGGSPLIRGFSTNRLLITVDGVRFNTAIFRGGNVQNIISIDPFAIERTEVILGPGSVVYGSDAIGGVMNFYTKKPKFSFVDGLSFSGNATTRYSTANQEKTAHVDLNFGLKEWAFLTSISASDFDDLKMGSHGPDDYLRTEYVETINGEDAVVQNDDSRIQRPTGYNQLNAMQKLRYVPSLTWDFNLGLFYTTTSDYPRYDRLIRRRSGNLRDAEWYYGPQEWMAGNIQITNKDKKIYDQSSLTLSYQQFKESRNDRDFRDIVLFETDEKVTAYSAGWDFTKKFNKSNLFYGVEYVRNTVNSEGRRTDTNTRETEATASRYPDGSTWQSMAAYSSAQWHFSEKVSMQGGLRYNYVLVDATFDEEFFDFPFSEANISTGALTGSLGLAWNPSEILGLKFNYSTAFRAPNIDDVGKIFDSEPGSVVVPNPDLKPEFAKNYEVAATLNFEGVVKLDVAGYLTQLEDAMVRRDFNLDGQTEILYQGELSNVQAIQNAAMAEVYGFEVGVEVNFSKALQLTSHYNITDGFEEDDDGNENPIRHAAPKFGNTHFTFKSDKLKLDAFAIYNGQFDFEDLAPSQQNNAFLYAKDRNGNPYSPNWYTLNFGAQYKITKALQLNATLENITDQRYRGYSSGIAAAGRNLIVAASYSF